jgi:N-acetylneuraminic acid mutarotase
VERERSFFGLAIMADEAIRNEVGGPANLPVGNRQHIQQVHDDDISLQALELGVVDSPVAPLRPPTVVIRPSSQAMLRQQAPSPVHGPPGLPYHSNNNNNNYVPLARPPPNPPNPMGVRPELHQQQYLQQQQQQQQRPSHLSLHIPEREFAVEEQDEEDDGLDSPTPNNGWTIVDAEGVPPSARSLHAAALLNGSMYSFGGFDGTQRVNTFHAFSFAEKRWSPVLPSGNSPPPPSPRDRHVSVAYGNAIYIQGGFDNISRLSDFYAFDFSTMAWREILASQGRPPTPRHSHAAVVAGHSMFVFAGYDGAYKNDLTEFDFQLSRWSVVPAVGRRPRARYRTTCVVHKQSLIVYGGHDGTRHLSDTHVFDLATLTWHNLVTEGIPPIPRDSHVSVIHGQSMYVFGGSTGSAMNDLHELQLPATPTVAARWRPVQTSKIGQPRPRFCHVGVAYNDSMFCFGGYSGADRLNDFIRFDFAVYDLSFEVPPSTVINDLRSMINDSTLSDITFVVEDKPIYAHKLLLARSSYFQALFLGNMRESTLETIRLEQVRYPIFMQVLEYLYSDHVRISFNDAMELFEAADLFCIPRLKTMCEKRMLQSITVDNAATIFHAADMHSATALRQKARKYILAHFEEASKTHAFEEMGRRNIELLFELLQGR